MATPHRSGPALVPAHLSNAAAFILHYVRRRPVSYGGLVILVIAAAGCAVLVQYGMKILVDSMAAPENARSVWAPFSFFLGFIAAEQALWRFAGWIGCRTVIATGVDIRLDLLNHLFGHSVGYFNERLSGALGNRITATAGAAGALGNTFTWNILPPCADFLGTVIVLSTVHWEMSVALSAFALVAGGGIILFGARGKPLHHAYAEQASYVGGELVDVVSNSWAVKAFSARTRERERLARKFSCEASAQRDSWLHMEKMRVLHDSCLWLMAGGMMGWAIYLWTKGAVTAGDVVMTSALTFRILHGSRDLAFALVGATGQIGVISETLRVIGRPHDVIDQPGVPAFAPRGGSVEFEDVTFAYPQRPTLFDNVSLSIPAGQKVCLVGPSGAGKSTFVALVQRLYDVQHGRVLIDGQCVTDVTQDSLRSALAVVPQEIPLFHRSIFDNIRYGRPEATDEEVFAAARHAYCDEFITTFPNGYDTVTGDRGILLSGGQRQRIGIARAFLKNAPILILDEATSALDTGSEAWVKHAVAELMRARTVIAVAHRLSTIAFFERAIVLRHGTIVQDGKPAEILQGSAFADGLQHLTTA